MSNRYVINNHGSNGAAKVKASDPVAILLGAIILVPILWLLGALLFWLGWNHFLIDYTNLPRLSFVDAIWAAVFGSGIRMLFLPGWRSSTSTSK